MHGIECAGHFLREANLLHAENLEAGLLNTRDHFALKIFPDAIRFENRKCSFYCHVFPFLLNPERFLAKGIFVLRFRLSLSL